MNRHILLIAAMSMALITGPVLGQSAAAPTQAVELPDATLPPELERVLRDYERAWRAGDAKALAALFAEDGFVLQGNHPPVRGRTAIQAAYVGQGEAPLRLRALAYSVEESIGYIIGACGYGDAPGDMGKFTLTLRRAPGGPWMIFSDMDNLNAPPPKRANTLELYR